MSAVLIAVTGDGPGLGKSTLAASLAEALGAELFREADIETDPCFADVMAEFRSTGEVTRETLLRAAGRYAADVEERGPATVALDSLFPYLPSLLAWGHSDDDITTFFTLLAGEVGAHRLVQVHLTGDLGRALHRAAAREGGDWLQWQIAKTDAHRGAGRVASVDDLVDYLDAGARRARRLLATAPWTVIELDVSDGAASTLTSALSALGEVGVPAD